MNVWSYKRQQEYTMPITDVCVIQLLDLWTQNLYRQSAWPAEIKFNCENTDVISILYRKKKILFGKKSRFVLSE